MPTLNRRAFINGIGRAGAALGLGACSSARTRSTAVDPAYQRREVDYPSRAPRGSIIVDASAHYLYWIEGNGKALRYGVGVGSEGFGWSGVAAVHEKREWPDWYPTNEFLERRPEVVANLKVLQSGIGIPGGPDNPLGARALYLWQGKKDTLYRIHGTNEPDTIGRNVSSGCIRMINDDVVDLYDRTPIGTKVTVLAPTVG
jgi:lipoprotein-anchoring transpeptidase ErfK/SrfK